MLEISPKIVKDVGLSVADITNYLVQHGWQQITSQNDRLQVFQGINDDLGNPIILPLPIASLPPTIAVPQVKIEN